jgi:hypothetical protein
MQEIWDNNNVIYINNINNVKIIIRDITKYELDIIISNNKYLKGQNLIH